jgi:magnesium transporter
MLERFIQKNVIWIDIQSPTNEEIHQVMTEFAFPPGLVNDLSTSVPRSEAVRDGKTIKLTLDFPIIRRTDMNGPHEVKFFVSDDFLITVHYEDIGAIDSFKKEFDVITTLKKASKKMTGTDIFIALMNELYSSTAKKLDYVQSLLTELESEIRDGHEKELVFRTSELTRKLITFRQTLKDHDDVFRDAREHFEVVAKKSRIDELEDLRIHYLHVLRRTGSLFETLEELRDTNTALLTTKQNEIMKTLTIMAFITFPLTLVTSTFGMNTIYTPIIGIPGDFWVILGFMLLATIGFFAYFKFKKWM